MNNDTRRYLLQRHRQSGYPGSVMDVFRAHDQGIDLIGQFEQQNNIQVARTPQQQQQGLRPAHQAGNVSQSMIFPNVPPNTPFTTKGMKAPINIEKYDEQGHLVKSYENVPPGIADLPMGPQRGTVIETPANMQSGGGVDEFKRILKEHNLKEDSTFENIIEVFDPTGISAWDDAYRAYTSMRERGSYMPNVDEGLDMLGALPVLGKAGKVLNFYKKSHKPIKHFLTEAYNKGFRHTGRIASGIDGIEDETGFLNPKQKGGPKEDYNMARAKELGYKPDSTGHYPSVDHETGMLLKSKEHPTVKLEFMSQMLSPERKMIANPTGYFGENQLQYVPRKKMQLGGFDYTPPIAQAIEAAGGFDEYQAQQDLAADLNELNSRPTISEGNFDVDEDGMIIEDRPSILEMAANPMATLRTVIDPSVEGLPSQVEFDQAKAKGNMAGQIANDLVNPAAYLNYGVNAFQDFGQATNYALQGEGRKALQSFGSGAMNALGTIPAVGIGSVGSKALRSAGVTGVGDLYKANPYLKNPMGFRNVGDKPHFLLGYNKKIDPMRMDLSPEAGFNQFLGQRDLLDKRLLKGNLGNEAHEDLLQELYRKSPFDDSIGQGSFGAVHPIRGTDYVMKMGMGEFGQAGLPAGRYSGITDDFIDRASDLSSFDNVAIPLRSNTIPQKNFGPSRLERFPVRRMVDGEVRDITKTVRYQPEVPRTEVTLMKDISSPSQTGISGLLGPQNAPPGLVYPSRDQFAAGLRQIRQMRDRGIAVDIDNLANVKFDGATGNFSFFDLENVPQLAGRNQREFAQLQARYGEMTPYPQGAFTQKSTYANPFEYMHEVRRVMGTQAMGIPNKGGLRLMDNFQKGGPRKVLTMGMPGKVDVIGEMAGNEPAKFADLAGTDFNLEWNNSPMAQQMLTESYMKSNRQDDDKKFVLSAFDLVGAGNLLNRYASQQHARNKIAERNKNLLSTSYLPSSDVDEFADQYGDNYRSTIRAFFSPGRNITVYNPNYSGQLTDKLLGTGVHERSHASDRSSFPLADFNMMQSFRSSDEEGEVVQKTSDRYREYVQEPTETRARIMDMRRGLYNQGVDVFNSPVTREQFDDYLKSNSRYNSPFGELNTGYSKDDIFKMLNAIAYEGDNNLPQNVARRGGKRPMRKYFKLRK